MTAPMLNRRFALEARDVQPDGHGGYEDVWMELGTLWGELYGVSGRDVERDAAALTTASVRITVRSAASTSPERPLAGQRFRDGTRVFAILSVVDRDVTGRWLTCYCREEAVR